jgi:RNAse (barnase) inhibitor barstar
VVDVDFCPALDINPPYVHLAIATGAQMASLAASRDNGGAIVRTLDGNKMLTLDGLFDEFGEVFEFPGYFGRNLDAFNDCITDLEWLNPKELILTIITDASMFLQSEEPDRLRSVLRILHKAGLGRGGQQFDGYIGRPAIPFHTVFQSEKSVPDHFLNVDIPVGRLDLSV